jgi:hypothetical protein
MMNYFIRSADTGEVFMTLQFSAAYIGMVTNHIVDMTQHLADTMSIPIECLNKNCLLFVCKPIRKMVTQ